jgi:hypothetical protein
MCGCLSRNHIEQRGAVRFPVLEGLNPVLIYSELELVYDEGTLALPTVYNWPSRFRDGRTELSDDSRFGRPRKSDLVEAVLSMLKERPFSSCMLLVRQLKVTKAICL